MTRDWMVKSDHPKEILIAFKISKLKGRSSYR